MRRLINGGGERDRTDDLKLAKLPLSQLSYTPVGHDVCGDLDACVNKFRGPGQI